MSWWPAIVGLFAFLFHLLGILHAAHALMNVRTSQGTIAWAISLCSFPYVAIPLYWILGRNRFKGYVLARRAHEALISSRLPNARKDLAAGGRDPHPLFKPLVKLAGLPVTSGNEAKLLINGEIVYEQMFGAIERANNYVLVEFFIVKNDKVGMRFTELLTKKAHEGVRVHFIYDEIGSLKLSRRRVATLRNAGVKVRAFGSTRGKGNRFQINFRNHRKLVVIDGIEAYLGGLNIGDEYAGQSGRFGPWRDTHLCLTGPSALCAQITFLEDWHWAAGGELLDLNWEHPDVPEDGGRGIPVLVVPTGPADPLDSCLLVFLAVIEHARSRLWIASPYFVPDEAVILALQNAALRGVDIRILIPNNPDHWMVYLSSFSYLQEMDVPGIKIYRYHAGFMHQKVILIDSTVGAVGTANLDNRSFRLNFEITAFVDDGDFAREVEQMLEKDFAQSRRVTAADCYQRPIWFRAAVRIARIFAPVQ